jgi:hypothetical protein
MPDRWAIAAGNYSNPSTWNDGLGVPTALDDVYADGWTVTVDQDVTAISLNTTQRSGGTNGGQFNASVANRTITANINAGSNHCLVVTVTGITLNGNIVGGTATGMFGFYVNANSISYTINGNATGGSAANCVGVRVNGSNNTAVFNGNCNGGSFSNSYGYHQNAAIGTGSLTINGNCVGGSAGGCYGLYLGSASGTCTINGNAQGGSITTTAGVYNASTGVVVLNGIAIASNSSEAVDNLTGTFTIARAQHAANGRSPWTANGKFFFGLSTTNLTVNNSAGTQRMLGRVGG